MKIILTSPWHEIWRKKDGFLPWSCHMQADLPEDAEIYDPSCAVLCAVKRNEFQAATLDRHGMRYRPITVTQLSCQSLIHHGPYEYPCMGSWLFILTTESPDKSWTTTITRSHFICGPKEAIIDPIPFLTIHSETKGKAIETHKKTYWRFYRTPKF